MGRDELRNKFVAEYEARFAKWPAVGKPDQIGVWFRFVDSVSMDRYGDLFAAVAEAWGDRMGGPRLTVFQKAWRRISRKGRVSTDYEAPPEESCDLCGDTGRMWFLGVMLANGELAASVDPSEGILASYVVPCACTRGKRYGTDPIPAVVVRLTEAAIEQRLTVLPKLRKRYPRRKSPDTERQYAEQKLTPEPWLTSNSLSVDLVAESYRLAGKSGDTPQAATGHEKPRDEPWENLGSAPAEGAEASREPGDDMEEAVASIPGGYTEEETPF